MRYTARKETGHHGRYSNTILVWTAVSLGVSSSLFDAIVHDSLGFPRGRGECGNLELGPCRREGGKRGL
jgi:hypothetical protein